MTLCLVYQIWAEKTLVYILIFPPEENSALLCFIALEILHSLGRATAV